MLHEKTFWIFEHYSGLRLSAMKFDANCLCVIVQEVHMSNRCCTMSKQNIGCHVEISADVERSLRLLQRTSPKNSVLHVRNLLCCVFYICDSWKNICRNAPLYQHSVHMLNLFCRKIYGETLVSHVGMTIDAFASRNLQQHVLDDGMVLCAWAFSWRFRQDGTC